MPFTIRSLFQQGTTEGQSAGATGIMEHGSPQHTPPTNGGLPVPMSSPFGMEVPPANPFGGSLFKTRDAETGGGGPVQMRAVGGSPFSPTGGGQSAGLTVADVLPQLPPELAKMNSLPPDQPISIAPHLIEAALSTGRASIPIFEIYRVCPAIFQSPVSPQDPRQVPLPAAKLPSLIAASQNHAQQAPSAFAQLGQPPAAMPVMQSPFVNAPTDTLGANPLLDASVPPRAQAVLPPRRENGVPPPIPGTAAPFAAHPVHQPALSPFGGGSPFASTPQPPAAAASSSPFSFQTVQPAVEFQTASFGSPAPVSPSPLSAQNVAPPQPAPDAPAPGSLLNSLFGSSPALVREEVPLTFATPTPAPHIAPSPALAPPFEASPFGQTAPPPYALTEPEPAQQVQAAAPSPFHSAPQSAVQAAPLPTAIGGPLKLSLATLLKGYTSTDLGFDPGMVPSWIMTSVQASTIQEQMAAGSVQIELGQLIDGTTDIGFRNVLGGARRDLKIQLPANELFHGLPATPQPHAQPPSPLFAAVQPAPAPAAPPPMPLAQPVQPPQPLNPFAAAKMAQSGPLQPSAATSAISGPIQPKPNANFGFAMPAPAPVPEHPAAAQPKTITAFDPFAATTAQPWSGQPQAAAFPQAQAAEGFSSDQLFGSPPALLPSPQLVPMPVPEVAPPAMRIPPQPAPVPAVPEMPAFTALPGIPPPPAAPSGLSFLTGTALQASAPQPSFMPPPVPRPFSGPLTPLAPVAPAPTALMPPPMPEASQAASVPLPPPPMPATSSAAPTGSILGIVPVAAGDMEQVMLRALLGVNENLTVGRVVDLLSKIPGIAACSCVNGASAVSHGASSQTAQDFQKQAANLARSIQALAPLIGIADAETFSVNTNDRLMTFSFHPPIALGVLHQDNDLAAGLRDKITLVGRELARMVAKTGGHIA